MTCRILCIFRTSATLRQVWGDPELLRLGLTFSIPTLLILLAHELGHFRNRDHIRSLGRGVVIGIAFGIIAGADTLGVTVADLTLRGFSREQESDADEFGLSLVQSEYGHVNDSWGFFEELIEAGDDSDGLITFASTHPATDDRVREIKDHARSNGWPLEGPLREMSD